MGLNSILKEAWTITQSENAKGDKIKAIALAKDCYTMKLEMLTNATVVNDAIRFVASNAVTTIERFNEKKMNTGHEESININDIKI